MKNFIDWEKLTDLSQGNVDIEISLLEKTTKLFEEGGELAQAVLHYNGSKNVSASAGDTKEDVLEEACDVLNVTLDIIISLGFTPEEAEAMFSKKLDKWASKVNDAKDNEILALTRYNEPERPESWMAKLKFW